MAGLGIRSPNPGFQLPSSSSSSETEPDDDAPLPFPAALPRSDFLAPGFHPATYLSALPHRHQTLDDLKSDLRERSAAISNELLELVNANYTSFLSLGDDLRGGDEKVEDVKVAMLGFRRQIDEVKARVRARREEVGVLTDELGSLRRDIEIGRRMLELDDRLAELEERLAVASLPNNKKQRDNDEDDGWSVIASELSDDEDENYPGLVGSSPAKLSAFAADYCIIEALAESLGLETPFVVKAEARMTSCRNTLLLDLSTAMREARKAGDKGKPYVVRYLAIYGMLDAEKDAIKALKGS